MESAVPVISRGHNVAVLLPPIPEALSPLLAAIPRQPILVIASDRDRALQLARSSGVAGAAVATAGATATPEAPLVVAAAADALELVGRSIVRPAAFAAIVLAWPEDLDEDGRAALEALLAEADKDTQRLIVTSRTGAATEQLVDRYAFKAMTYGFPSAEPGLSAPAALGPAQYVVAPPSRVEDWILLVREALGAEGLTRPVAPCPASRDEAAALAAGRPVLVLTPGQLGFVRTLFNPLTPLPMPGAAAGAARRASRLRADVAALAEAGDLDRELLVLAPLFDRFDPAVVAAAALRLASQRPPAASGTPAAAATPAHQAHGRIWVGIGRKDNVRPGDLVGALVNEAKVPADAIGKIEVKDLFCLVEIRADHAEMAAKGLTGTQVRGRRLIARVDRGPGSAGKPPRRT